MFKLTRTLAAVAALLGAASAPAAAQPWRDSLQAHIDQAFTNTRGDTNFRRITQPGTVLVLQKDGIGAKPGSAGSLLESHYANGTIAQPRGFMAFMSGANTMRPLKAGEKVYVVGSRVRGEGIMFSLVTTETTPVTVNGNTEQSRYSASVVIDFPRGYLATASVDSVMARIGEVLKTEAAVSAPVSIGLGQTPEQVEQALGKPETVINLGPKVVYVYRAMKVIFENGRVADVQ